MGANSPTKDKLPEKLRLRPDDSELAPEHVLGISLFKELSRRAEGRLRGTGGRGAVVLRRYQAGEVICRQSEPGWTAFYFLKTEDLLWLRESQLEAADTSDQVLAIQNPEALRLSIEQRLLRADEFEEHGDKESKLTMLLRVSAWRPDPAELTKLRQESETMAAADRLRQELAQSHPRLLALDAAMQRRNAEELRAAEPELAVKLRLLGEADELRTRAQVFVSAHTTDPVKVQPAGLLARLGARLSGSRPAAAPPPPAGGAPSDNNVPGDGRLVHRLCEGELFGEMSCLHHTPRSATVRAVRDCYALEFLSAVLDLLKLSERFRADLDAVYRSRALNPTLRSSALFANAPDEAIELLRSRAELLTKRPGEILFHEGDVADSLYLVRNGTVKVFQRDSGRVLGYRSAGEMLGEQGLISGQQRNASCAAYEHPRAAHDDPARAPPSLPVELVRIDKALFEEVCARVPTFRAAVARAAQPGSHLETPSVMAHGTSRYGELGLMQGRKLMLIDLDRCTRCGDCVRACASAHDDRLPRLAVEGPRFGKYLIATSCRQCADPVCLIGCPVSAIHKGAAGQIVIEDWCINCGLCAAQCPYHAIELRAAPQRGALTCDQCATLPSGPACVSACPHDAAARVDANRFFSRTRVG